MVKARVLFAVLAGCFLMTVSAIFETSSALEIVRILTQTGDPSSIKRLALMSPIGSIIGCFLFCSLAEVFGRKYTLPTLGLPFIFSFTICQCICSDNFPMFCLARMIGGLSVGGSFAVLPLYIAEIARKTSRGTSIAVLNSSFVLGRYFVPEILKLTTETSVRSVVNYGSLLLSTLSILIFAAIAIQSRSYYIRRVKTIETVITFTKRRNQNCNIRLEQGKAKKRTNIENPERIVPCLKDICCLKAVLMMLGLVILQCFSGINDFAFYFTSAYGKFSPDTKHIPFLISACNVVTATLCPSLVDRIGRKLCLMLSYTGMATSLILLLIINAINKVDITSYFLIYIGSLFYISLNIGATAIPLVLMGELFPLRTKMIASAVITAISFSLQLSYISANDYSSDVWPYVNIVSSIICVIVVKFYYLETKGKTLKQIQLALKKF